MRISRRHTVWLTAVLFFAVAFSVWFVAFRTRITQANLDRIQIGMTVEEVIDILGEPSPGVAQVVRPDGHKILYVLWEGGPNHIIVHFDNRRVQEKFGGFAPLKDSIEWYVKKGLRAMGVPQWVWEYQ
ncbi:MAG TPA: outer membrane protein assembly factor BamE [Gemmataceae bacterium]|jgi:hypothetical protein|nr:outer membrane protein assembly factor BamE [Gemmataceae bacterium]